MIANRASNPARFFATMFTFALLALGLALVVATMPGAVNVPVPVTVNEHALTKHTDAEFINHAWQYEEYECLRIYRTGSKNRLLYRFTYANMDLEGGMITTTSGAPVTAYMRTRAGWDAVIVRDGFYQVLSNGQCPN